MAPVSEVDRFGEFFRMLGHELEDFQQKIVEEIFSPRRETLVLIPRGCGKSTLLAAVALWSLLRGRGQQIVVGSRVTRAGVRPLRHRPLDGRPP